MIANEREYRITRRWLSRFEQSRRDLDQQTNDVEPRMQQALRDQVESEIDVLRSQLAEYDALRRGEVTVLELESLRAIPEALIRARAAANISQEELASRIGLRKQQVQRYEATRYAGVSLDRIQEIADALGVRIHERIELPTHR